MERVQEKKDKRYKKIREWTISIAIAFTLAILVRIFLIYKVYIPSSSMVPTLNPGDRLFITRVYKRENLKRGDVLVFHSDEGNDTYIKRLIGLPGDKIEIKNGLVIINGQELKEDYVKNQLKTYSNEFEVPDNKYFFLGDNRVKSNDSRLWVNPYIDGEDIQGKAQIKIYPFDDFGFLK